MSPITPRQRPCRNCRQQCAPPPWWEGRCAACHQHWRRFGEERPRDQRRGGVTRRVPCRNCRRLTGPRELAWGRCRACAEYWRRNRTERPQGGAAASPPPRGGSGRGAT